MLNVRGSDAENGHVSAVHACVLCGWSRPGAAATILDPHCPSCGGLLRAMAAPAEAADPPAEAEAVAGRIDDRLLDALRVVLLVLVMVAAAVAGARSGGPFVAAGAVGLAIMLGTPVAFTRR